MRHLGPFLFSQSKWWSWWSWGSRHVVSSPIIVVLKPPSSSLSQFFGKSERREVSHSHRRAHCGKCRAYTTYIYLVFVLYKWPVGVTVLDSTIYLGLVFNSRT